MQTNDGDSLSSLPIGSLADWMDDECAGVDHVALVPQLRNVTADDLTAQSVPALLAVVFDKGQPHRARCSAADAILAKFSTPRPIPSPEELQTNWACIFEAFSKLKPAEVVA